MNTWDETKRAKTLSERGLDFADAEKVFAGDHFDEPDDRKNYGEPRIITAGWLEDRSWCWCGRRAMADGASFR